VPRLGTYRVRLSIHSTCDFVSPASPAPSCAGGPIGGWEVVARLEP
jgi:hypothetical protein